MDVDLDEFRPYFAEYDLDEAQKTELIRTLWNIMCAFVDLGWGVDSIHFSLPELSEFSTSESEAELKSVPRITMKEETQAAFADPPGLEDS